MLSYISGLLLLYLAPADCGIHWDLQNSLGHFHSYIGSGTDRENPEHVKSLHQQHKMHGNYYEQPLAPYAAMADLGHGMESQPPYPLLFRKRRQVEELREKHYEQSLLQPYVVMTDLGHGIERQPPYPLVVRAKQHVQELQQVSNPRRKRFIMSLFNSLFEKRQPAVPLFQNGDEHLGHIESELPVQHIIVHHSPGPLYQYCTEPPCPYPAMFHKQNNNNP